MSSQLLWLLIGLQIAMAVFDTVYHHEFIEGLAWRVSQRRELVLHAARSLTYAVLFATLGFAEVHGAFALLTIAALAGEITITLADFIEEDVSRKLPASERMLHTLLALNYGAILVLLVPLLIAWTADATAITPAFHGRWSVLAALSAVGATVFGVRDIAAGLRAARLTAHPPADLVEALNGRRTILITGATGFIGSRLASALSCAGHDVIALTRNPASAIALPPPLRVITSLDQLPSDTRLDAIVNLAGEPVANGLWTRAKRRRILASRLRATAKLVHLITRLQSPPQVLISGSAIGWYGLWQDEELTEFDGGKNCFTHRVCEAWEQSARRAQRLGVRVVRLRIGLVLGIEGGLLRRLLVPFEYGLGGRLGSGIQWMSWIARDDLMRLIAHGIATPGMSGPVNATAPEPVRNRDFTATLARVLHRPARLRLPAALLHGLAGGFADELLLGGQRVLPAKAEQSGFVFRYPTLASALADMLGSRPARAARPDSLSKAPATACLAEQNPATPKPNPPAISKPTTAMPTTAKPTIKPSTGRVRIAGA